MIPKNHVLQGSSLLAAGATVLVLSQGCVGNATGAGQSVEGTPGQVTPGNVVTYHNDNFRSGQNPNEKILTRENVNSASFGKIGSLPVDGVVYAQPLYVQNVPQNQAPSRNLVIVATEHDSVYAFDADSLSTQPVWQRSFISPTDRFPCTGCTTLTILDVTCPNVSPVGTAGLAAGNDTGVEVGITATPVADPVRGVLYVVAASKENGEYHQKIHALDLSTGDELTGDPIDITGQYAGTGYTGTPGYHRAPDVVNNGMFSFQPGQQLSRAALALQNDVLYVGFSSYDDQEPTHGWLFAYNALTLDQFGAFVTTPNTGDGTIWMSGDGPAIDLSDNVFFATGNGDPTVTASTDTTDKDDSVIKVGRDLVHGGLQLLDWFMPYNRFVLVAGLPNPNPSPSANPNPGDVDLGSGGVMLLPDNLAGSPNAHLMVAGGKQGTIYVLNRDNMGQFNSGGDQVVQALSGQNTLEASNPANLGLPGGQNYDGNFSTPSYFAGNGHLYIAGSGDGLRSYPVVGGLLDTTGMTKASYSITRRGATTSISSNQNAEGIVWLIDSSQYNYKWTGVTATTVPITSNGPAILMAYDADDVAAGPLYQSARTVGASDAAGNATKFSVPTVAGGKVFVGTQTEITVYGLK